MNYSKIITHDLCNGEGWRVTLFVSGCKRNCPGCFNPETHDPNYGKPFTNDVKQLIFNELSKDTINGLSILGGEPMSVLSDNRKQVIQLCKECKEKFPTKNIWMWSSYTFEEILKDSEMSPILDYIDILVDGPFNQNLKDPYLKFRGSSNQRLLVIDNKNKEAYPFSYKSEIHSEQLPNNIILVHNFLPQTLIKEN